MTVDYVNYEMDNNGFFKISNTDTYKQKAISCLMCGNTNEPLKRVHMDWFGFKQSEKIQTCYITEWMA